MKLIFSLLILIILSSSAFAREFRIEGIIFNKANNTGLSYANIRVSGTTFGVSANIEGRYQLSLAPGTYKLIASFIGFRSDTLTINLKQNIADVNFILTPVAINLPEITVLPGENPALEIIRKAIESKHNRNSKINSYEFEAYTKGVIRSDQDMSANSNSVSLGVGSKDSAGLKINAILENQSRGYFKNPDDYKEFIIAQKQSANLPASINILTGGRIIQNFYSDDLRFFDRPMPGPISDNAIDYYYFYIVDTLAIDNQNVFKIYFAPDNDTDPGFQGHVYITDKTFNLLRIDVDLNRAANTGGLFEKINIFQQFLPYDEDIYMPIDYRLFVKINVFGLARVGLELNSVMHNYKINPDINKDMFDMAILTVVPGADAKDTTYWSNIQTIPNTEEELAAYKMIDSLERIPKSFWDDFPSNLLADKLYFNENYSVTAPLGLYHFNRIEGHSLDLGFYTDNLFNRRFDSGIDFNYGFSDKKLKSELNLQYLAGMYRDYRFTLNAFNKLQTLFPESDSYNDFTSSVLALFTKYEYRDYYYTKGFNAGFSGRVTPILNMNAEFLNRTDNSAANNSDFSFFAKKKKYKDNPPVYDTRINAVSAGFRLDFRKYIEDGYFRRRVSEGNSYMLISGNAAVSDSKIGSSLDFIRYDARLNGELNTFRSAGFRYDLYGTYSDGPVPYQMFYALPGNIEGVSQSQTFRTLRVSEYVSDKAVTFKLEHQFGDELFRIARIPVLKSLELQFTAFFNAAWMDISDKSKSIIPVEYKVLRKPLYEAGFNIGHVLFPLRLELTWRLNHRERNRFVIGVNTPVL